MLAVKEETYSINQLAPKVRKRVIDEYREGYELHDEWWDQVYEDAQCIAYRLGFGIIDINFSGFWTQGSGASFTGQWDSNRYDRPRKDEEPITKYESFLEAVKDYAPQDEKLHIIAQDMDDVVAIDPSYADGNLTARITLDNGHYCHSGMMNIDIDLTIHEYNDDGTTTYVYDLSSSNYLFLPGTEKNLKDCIRAFADWIYRQLEEEHTYLTSDEILLEQLAENTYTKDGEEI